MNVLRDRLIRVENVIHRELIRHSAAALRIAVGAVFLGFGVLKFFPGVSPAESLVLATTDKLTLGLFGGHPSLVFIAALESFIGALLILGRWLRLAVWLLAIEFVGILSPLVLLPGRLFAGPHHAPTLEGQYVLKDVILVTAGMIIAALSFRGGRMIRQEPADLPASATGDADHRLRVVVAGMRTDRTIPDVCAEHQIDEATYYLWRDEALLGATRALDEAIPAPDTKRSISE